MERGLFALFLMHLFKPQRQDSPLLAECSPRFRQGFVETDTETERRAALDIVYEEIACAAARWETGLVELRDAAAETPHLVRSPEAYWARQTLPRLAGLRASLKKHTTNVFTAPSDMTLLPELDGEIQQDEDLRASKDNVADLQPKDWEPSEDEGRQEPPQESDPEPDAPAEGAAAQFPDLSGLSLPCGRLYQQQVVY